MIAAVYIKTFNSLLNYSFTAVFKKNMTGISNDANFAFQKIKQKHYPRENIDFTNRKKKKQRKE